MKSFAASLLATAVMGHGPHVKFEIPYQEIWADEPRSELAQQQHGLSYCNAPIMSTETYPKNISAWAAEQGGGVWNIPITAVNDRPATEYVIAVGPYEADVLLFLSCYATTHKFWSGFMADETLRAKYRMVFVDYRGEGGSRPPSEPREDVYLTDPYLGNWVDDGTNGTGRTKQIHNEDLRTTRHVDDIFQILTNDDIISPTSKITFVGHNGGAWNAQRVVRAAVDAHATQNGLNGPPGTYKLPGIDTVPGDHTYSSVAIHGSAMAEFITNERFVTILTVGGSAVGGNVDALDFFTFFYSITSEFADDRNRVGQFGGPDGPIATPYSSLSLEAQMHNAAMQNFYRDLVTECILPPRVQDMLAKPEFITQFSSAFGFDLWDEDLQLGFGYGGPFEAFTEWINEAWPQMFYQSTVTFYHSIGVSLPSGLTPPAASEYDLDQYYTALNDGAPGGGRTDYLCGFATTTTSPSNAHDPNLSNEYVLPVTPIYMGGDMDRTYGGFENSYDWFRRSCPNGPVIKVKGAGWAPHLESKRAYNLIKNYILDAMP